MYIPETKLQETVETKVKPERESAVTLAKVKQVKVEQEIGKLDVNPNRGWLRKAAQRENREGFSEFLLDASPEEQRSDLFPAGRFPHDKDQLKALAVEAEGRAVKGLVGEVRKDLERLLFEQMSGFNPHSLLLVIASLRDVILSVSSAHPKEALIDRPVNAGSMTAVESKDAKISSRGGVERGETRDEVSGAVDSCIGKLDEALKQVAYFSDRLLSKTNFKVERYLIEQVEALAELKDKLGTARAQLEGLQAGNRAALRAA